MQDNSRFDEIYLALVALIWEALERIDALLCNDAQQRIVEERLQWLRLELLQLADRSGQCATARRLTTHQDEQVQELVFTLLDCLELPGPPPAGDVIRLRIGAAQDWLLDEAGRISIDEPAQFCETTRNRIVWS